MHTGKVHTTCDKTTLTAFYVRTGSYNCSTCIAYWQSTIISNISYLLTDTAITIYLSNYPSEQMSSHLAIHPTSTHPASHYVSQSVSRSVRLSILKRSTSLNSLRLFPFVSGTIQAAGPIQPGYWYDWRPVVRFACIRMDDLLAALAIALF